MFENEGTSQEQSRLLMRHGLSDLNLYRIIALGHVWSRDVTCIVARGFNGIEF